MTNAKKMDHLGGGGGGGVIIEDRDTKSLSEFCLSWRPMSREKGNIEIEIGNRNIFQNPKK